MRHPCEYPGAPKPRHDYHQAVKQRQRAEVDIPKICRVRRDKAAAHCCRDKRDAQRELVFYKVLYVCHSLYLLSVQHGLNELIALIAELEGEKRLVRIQ